MTKNKTSNTRSRYSRCPSCLKYKTFYYTTETADKRPRFVCTSCEATWTCGLSGGEFMKFAKEKSK